jgi:thioredoxin reductase (NADPH)
MINYDVIIIGAGPAGLTAAVYALRARLRTLIIESPFIISQAGYAGAIENFPGFPKGISGVELLSRFKDQVGLLGGNIISGNVREIKTFDENSSKLWQVFLEDNQYKTVSIIAACGAAARRLEVKGEAEFLGKGVSYCAVCDGMFFKDKDIAVVGGGDSAVEEALFLTRFAAKVYIIHRRNKLRAAKILQDRALADKKINILWDSVIEEIIGGNKVTKLKIKNTMTGLLEEMACDGLFVSIGKTPNAGFLKNIIDINEDGYIITDKELRTSAQGIFACGDCRDTLFRQVITACGDGALAAESCTRYIDSTRAS